MNIFETLRLALRSLNRNKMRSFLTSLGIIIGVSAVISMIAIGEGAKAKVEQAFSAMGSNLLIVLSGSSSMGGLRGGFGSMPTLTLDDVKAIQTDVSSVERAAPIMQSRVQISSEESNWSSMIIGTSLEYFEIRNWRPQSGQLFTQSDFDASMKIILLGQTVANKLFTSNQDPVGQIVRIKNTPFQVIGVLEKKGQSPMGQDYDDTVIIPMSTYQSKISRGLGRYLSGIIYVEATSLNATKQAEQQITALLRERHHLAVGSDDDFSIRNLSELASSQQEGTQTMTTLLASIAAVSLLVGGIGIMNIMLVSVTERTREIGLRMAIGAKPYHILTQFLIESSTLSLMGGLIGILMGVSLAYILSEKLMWPMILRNDIMLLSVVLSSLVGIIFGIYPAKKAAALNPIEALRYE